MKNVPLLPEDVKNEILSHVKEDEQCETAWTHILNCQRCTDEVFNTFFVTSRNVSSVLHGLGFGIGAGLMKMLPEMGEKPKSHRKKKKAEDR